MDQRIKTINYWLKEMFRGIGGRYAVFVVVTTISALLTLLPPRLQLLFSSHIASLTPLSQAGSFDFVRELFFFGLLVACALVIANCLRVITEEWLALSVEGQFSKRIVRKLMSIPLSRLDQAQRGDWLTRMSGDMRGVEHFLTMSLPHQLHSFFVLLGVTVVLVWHGGLLFLPLLTTAVLLAWINVKVNQKLEPALSRLRDMHGQAFQSMIESFEGIRSIRTLEAEDHVVARFQNVVQQISRDGLKTVKMIARLIGTNTFVTQLASTSVLCIVVWKFRDNQLTVADALAYPFYLGLFLNSSMDLVNSLFHWNRFLIEGRRLIEIMAEVEGDHLAPQRLSSENMSFVPQISEDIPLTLKSKLTSWSLNLSHVVIGYGEEKQLTVPINLKLNRGEVVVVQGPSGCGKSTLLDILAGLRPAVSGEFQVSVTFSEPPSFTPSQVHYRSFGAPSKVWATLVEQRPYLFEGSIRENISFSLHSHYSQDFMWDVLEALNLQPFLSGVGGLDYQIKDSGKNLSEGQKYRLALARALLRNKLFLLLDEPFASLDPASISAVCRALKEKRQELGVVIVTHAIPDELDVDRVFDFSNVTIDAPFHSQTAHSLPLANL